MLGLPEKLISDMPSRVGRKKVNEEQTPARFPGGTLARIGAALVGKETRAGFIKTAVERELERREKS